MISLHIQRIVRQARPSGARFLTAATILIAGIAAATPVAAFTSAHAALDLVWGPGAECDHEPMALLEDFLWSCDVAVPAAGRYYFQAWTGGLDDPKYGADPSIPDGVLLADDPAAIPYDFAAAGLHAFRILEAENRFEIIPAPGAMCATVIFADAPQNAPADLAVRVHAHDGGALVGGYVPVGTPDVIDIVNLWPGRSYDLTFSASGYADHIETRALPDATTLAFTVTLEPLVPNEAPTWGAVKSLYR